MELIHERERGEKKKKECGKEKGGKKTGPHRNTGEKKEGRAYSEKKKFAPCIPLDLTFCPDTTVWGKKRKRALDEKKRRKKERRKKKMGAVYVQNFSINIYFPCPTLGKR